MFTQDDAEAFLRDHTLSGEEQALYEALTAAWGSLEPLATAPLNIVEVLAHLLTDITCTVMATQCPGDPHGCAEKAALLSALVEQMLYAKIIYHAGFPAGLPEEEVL